MARSARAQAGQIQQYIKNTTRQVGFIQEGKFCLPIQIKECNSPYQQNKEEKSHGNFLRPKKRTFDKIHQFTIIILRRLPQPDKEHPGKPAETSNFLTVNGDTFCPRMETRPRHAPSCFNHEREALAGTRREERETQDMDIRKKEVNSLFTDDTTVHIEYVLKFTKK